MVNPYTTGATAVMRDILALTDRSPALAHRGRRLPHLCCKGMCQHYQTTQRRLVDQPEPWGGRVEPRRAGSGIHTYVIEPSCQPRETIHRDSTVGHDSLLSPPATPQRASVFELRDVSLPCCVPPSPVVSSDRFRQLVLLRKILSTACRSTQRLALTSVRTTLALDRRASRPRCV